MIVAERKPFEEILDMLRPYKSVLNAGCAGCTAVCLAGGQREVDTLNGELKSYYQKNGHDISISGYTVERQCDMQFIKDMDKFIDEFDCVISMGCGAGVQLIAERYPLIPVFPALNTRFLGVNRATGWYEEKCRSCGNCQLAYTGGLCPVTGCAKSILNGPCGGAKNGKCEVDPAIECVWCAIYERLKIQGRLDNITAVHPHNTWQRSGQGICVQEPYRKKYSKN